MSANALVGAIAMNPNRITNIETAAIVNIVLIIVLNPEIDDSGDAVHIEQHLVNKVSKMEENGGKWIKKSLIEFLLKYYSLIKMNES